VWFLKVSCGVIFCGFISLLIGRETINIPEIFSGVHGSTGMTVIFQDNRKAPCSLFECKLVIKENAHLKRKRKDMLLTQIHLSFELKF